MKKAFSLFAITLLAIILFSNCNTSKKANQLPQNIKDPYITFDNPEHDFGVVKVGEKPSHIYTFTNTHSTDITIELISGCDCTTIQYYEGKTYKPEETGTIKITFDSTKEEDRGDLEKTIDILLENTDPKTGYQIIKEARYKLRLEE